MDYIVLDLEWNQSNPGDNAAVEGIPFEIIDIGAVRLNSGKKITGRFNQLVKPAVYDKMHYITSRIIHLQMEDLLMGRPFREVMEDFLEWCGTEYIFCTWGSSDLVEIQRNMKYYGMEPLGDTPIRYLDIQKLFSIAYEDKKERRSLECAIDFLKIPKNVPFHRAFSDAHYAAGILETIDDTVLTHYSIDTFVLPRNKQEEIQVDFDTYHKYISREFSGKAEALNDREVLSTRCFICDGTRNLKRKLKWFSGNGRHYYSVSVCPVHGYMKAKVRVRKSWNDGAYVVKTSKFITDEEFMELQNKKMHAKELRRLGRKR